ncbi:hypothetical protein [Pseudomonas paralactis]|uniref:hypothetical protein n=1 Tax=Pseudomonas paralactis TaxID=1615673 RepID=UPI001645F26C|nr:hypothetical protein [Pseudomonas paralactis]
MKRSLFAELVQGVEDMSEHRKGNITLRQYEMSKVRVCLADQDESGHAEALGIIEVQANCPGSAAD